jgi:hypothetical protein
MFFRTFRLDPLAIRLEHFGYSEENCDAGNQAGRMRNGTCKVQKVISARLHHDYGHILHSIRFVRNNFDDQLLLIIIPLAHRRVCVNEVGDVIENILPLSTLVVERHLDGLQWF